MQFYNSSNVETVNGSLVIHTTLGKTSWMRYDHIKKTWKEETKYFKSGMVQSWNKFCFTGGIIEVDMIVPGHPYIGGLWPAVWMLGNLGRATYEASTNNIWPWSFNKCDRRLQPKQDISACNEQNHFGLHPFEGRGATEIDIIEVMTGDSKGFFKSTNPGVALPYADMTLQVCSKESFSLFIHELLISYPLVQKRVFRAFSEIRTDFANLQFCISGCSRN